MKKLCLILFSFLFLTFFEQNINTKPICETNCVKGKKSTGSKSFFMPRSIIEDVSLYFALNDYYFHRKYFEPNALRDCEEPRIHVARGLFFEKSTCNKKLKHNVARYFLPNNKAKVRAAEDGTGDLGSLWFKVIAPDSLVYQSEITINPERLVFGSYFDYHQDFECINGLWLDIQFAVYQAKHKIRAKENVVNGVRGILPGAATVLQYLSSNELVYGRFSNCAERGGFDDIQLKLGYDFLGCPEKGYYVGLYGSLLLPISPIPTAETIFEPIVGRGFWGAGIGFDAGFNVWECEDRSFAIMADFSYQHLFRKTLLRSLDFKNNGNWSRYLRVVRSDAPGVSYPAINFTTLPVQVEPRGVINLWLAGHYQRCRWHGELGYNLWWRQAEKICLKEKKCDATSRFNSLNLGIFGMGNVCNPTSASTANISQGKTFSGTGNVVVNDETFVPLTLADLDLGSAAHPKTLTNKIYVAGAYDAFIFCRPVSVGLGASYEFNRNFMAFSQWGIWGNLETSF